MKAIFGLFSLFVLLLAVLGTLFIIGYVLVYNICIFLERRSKKHEEDK